LRRGYLLIAFALCCFALSPTVRAVLPSPTPDGGYTDWNTAEGQNALFNLTTGGFNTAIGGHALYGDTYDSANTAVGAFALAARNLGSQNTAVGQGALRNNTGGALGNVAVGYKALNANTTGEFNVANGYQALYSNTTGDDNTAMGVTALFSNIGNNNMADGAGALFGNTTGNNNTGLGVEAGLSVATASNVTCIGAGVAGADVSNTTWIGNVYGVTTQSGTTAPVIVSADGQLGTVASSERFKKDIAAMEKASEAILSLRPVTFHYKTDTKGTPQFGLIAEEVAKVNPALVLPDKEGKPYSVRYEQVNAMLLNEFLKEHKTVEEQRATVARQQKQIDALTEGLQRVSAQLELSKPAPQVVNNP
jgi:hypothetical protein